ncbi:MAG TPA: hypothetical protein VND94_00990 [Terriglobia bacterium]|nr:hypothetical protein [Terriglobia bacterium]
MARNTAFARQVQLFTDQVGEARRQALIQLAEESFATADRQNTEVLGRPAEYDTVVDGKAGVSPDRVKEGGTIVYLFKVGSASLQAAVDDAFRILMELSPVLTGRYQHSFRLFVNGTERDASKEAGPIELTDADEVEIVNMVPYSRRVERGWSNQAPNGVVEIATTALRAQYGNILQILFTYRGFIGADSGDGQLIDPMNDPTRRRSVAVRGGKGRFVGSVAAHGAAKAYNRSAQRWPTMTIKVR